MEAEDIISVQGLTFSYDGSRKILDDVTFTVKRGETLVIAGLSGSGKTTLCLLIAGLLHEGELSGSIGFAGGAPSPSTVGIVFQNPDDQMICTTVEDEIAFGLENLCLPPDEIRGRVSSCLELFGIAGLAAADPARLSGGQKKLVTIAAVLALSPQIVILDEPATGLDAESAAMVAGAVAELRAEKKTVIIVEHDLSSVRCADRILYLRDGSITSQAPPDEPGPDAQAEIRPPAPSGALAVSGLTYRYPGAAADTLTDFSCRFPRGTITALTGRNGSGKTTLCSLITGILQPDSGTVSADGADITAAGLFERGRIVGSVFQDPSHQIFCETVYDEVAYGLRNLGTLTEEEISSRTGHYLDFFRLGGLRDAFPGRLSQGEKQRVMLAAVMALGTGYVILDEPTSGLDMKGRRDLGELLRRIRNQGTGVVIISHERAFIDSYADCEIRLQSPAAEPMPPGQKESVSPGQAEQKPPGQAEPARTKRPALADVDPRTKLLIMAVVSTCSVITGSIPQLLALTALLAVILAAGGVRLPDMLRRAGTALKLIAGLFVIQCIFTRSGAPLLSAGGLTLLTTGGLSAALVVSIRLIILTCSALLLLTGESRDYLLAFTQMHVPYEIAFMVMTALKFIPLLRGEVRDVMAAVQMRGTKVRGAPWRERLRVYVRITLPVVAGLVRRADRMNAAMEARAFRAYSHRTSMRHIELRDRDFAVMVIAVASVAAIIVLI